MTWRYVSRNLPDFPCKSTEIVVSFGPRMPGAPRALLELMRGVAWDILGQYPDSVLHVWYTL